MTVILPRRLYSRISMLFIIAVTYGYFAVASAAINIPPPGGVVYGMEDMDWNVDPPTSVFPGPYHSKTPARIPGGRVIMTKSLMSLLKQNPQLLVIDVLGSAERNTLPGAMWLPGAGVANLSPDMINRFLNTLANLTNNDKNLPIVFSCLGAECWVSYNAALRAIAAGYNDVLWYRGGSESWRLAGGRLAQPSRLPW